MKLNLFFKAAGIMLLFYGLVFAQTDVNFGAKVDEYKKNIESLKKELQSENPLTRQDACLALGVIKDPDVIPLIRKLLADPDENVRAAAINALGFMQDAASITDIVKLGLKDAFGVVRAAAASTLVAFKNPKATPALRVMARFDKDAMVRITAAVSLNSLGDPSELPGVRKLTQDRNKDVNIYAASMLLAAGEKEYINIVRQGLTSTDKILRGACVNVLSQLADEASYKSLKYISKKDEDETIRVTAFKGCLLIESNMREKEKTGKTAR